MNGQKYTISEVTNMLRICTATNLNKYNREQHNGSVTKGINQHYAIVPVLYLMVALIFGQFYNVA